MFRQNFIASVCSVDIRCQEKVFKSAKDQELWKQKRQEFFFFKRRMHTECPAVVLPMFVRW